MSIIRHNKDNAVTILSLLGFDPIQTWHLTIDSVWIINKDSVCPCISSLVQTDKCIKINAVMSNVIAFIPLRPGYTDSDQCFN